MVILFSMFIACAPVAVKATTSAGPKGQSIFAIFIGFCQVT